MCDPYEDKQYWSWCPRGCLLNPNTRWCCHDCWIEQRSQCKSPRFSDTGSTHTEPPDPNSDLYCVLQLTPPKTIGEIRRQYHRLSLIYHPDKNPDGEEEFKRISNAYHHLINVI